MGKNLGKIGYIDSSFQVTLDDLREKFKKVGIEGLSDRQTSKVIADIFKEMNIDIKRTSQKRKDKVLIEIK